MFDNCVPIVWCQHPILVSWCMSIMPLGTCQLRYIFPTWFQLVVLSHPLFCRTCLYQCFWRFKLYHVFCNQCWTFYWVWGLDTPTTLWSAPIHEQYQGYMGVVIWGHPLGFLAWCNLHIAAWPCPVWQIWVVTKALCGVPEAPESETGEPSFCWLVHEIVLYHKWIVLGWLWKMGTNNNEQTLKDWSWFFPMVTCWWWLIGFLHKSKHRWIPPW